MQGKEEYKPHHSKPLVSYTLSQYRCAKENPVMVPPPFVSL